jgi:outer membrane protein assembly factor BamB
VNSTHLPRLATLLPVIALWLLSPRGSSPAFAGDWPQILGPQRDGTATAEQLPTTWPAAGPAVVWRTPVGEGYAGPAVVGNRVVVFHRVAEGERLEAFERDSGKSLWRQDFPATYRGGYDPNGDNGPRCVPTIAENAVVAYGAAGELHCVSLTDGKVRWSRSIAAEFRADEGYFGAGSSPVVVDNRVLVNAGGRPKAGIVALALDTGKTVWQTGEDDASYSAPTVVAREKQSIAIFVTRLHCVAVDPASGKELFRFPFGKRGPTVNAATPLVVDGQLFLTASYGIGAVLRDWKGAAPVELWANDDTMSSQYSTPVAYQGYLYGTHGREDIGQAEFRCIEAKSGKVAWSEPGFGVANAIRAQDKLVIVATDGRMLLAAASPQSFRKLGEGSVGRVSVRALPALSAGKLYLRTNRRGGSGGELICLDVSAAK